MTTGTGETARVSVVIPTRNEEGEIAACLASVASQEPAAEEVLVADGGSTDETTARVRAAGARVLSAPPGRAHQLNAGATAARGDVLLFLHADTRLPPGAIGAVVRALDEPDVVGGAWHKRFRSAHPLLAGVRWRTATWHAFGACFGDQGLFVRRSTFEELGGFRTDLSGEDCELVRRLRRRGRFLLLPQEVSTSARRLERRGVLRTWLSWWSTWVREWVRTEVIARR